MQITEIGPHTSIEIKILLWMQMEYVQFFLYRSIACRSILIQPTEL